MILKIIFKNYLDVYTLNLQGVRDYIQSRQDLNVVNNLGQTATIIGKFI